MERDANTGTGKPFTRMLQAHSPVHHGLSANICAAAEKFLSLAHGRPSRVIPLIDGLLIDVSSRIAEKTVFYSPVARTF
jgi:hypothetical protein